MHVVQRRGGEIRAYHQPRTLAEALDALADLGGRARLIAGGTDLLLEVARGGRPATDALVDVSRIPELAGVELDGDELVIGATTTANQLLADERVATHALPLAQALLELGAAQLRNRATLVGNVVTASPANDTISALLALGASVEIAAAGRERRVAAIDDFITGFRQVDLEPAELVTAIRVRTLGDRRGAFAKLGLRRAQAISVVHGAVVLDWEGEVVVGARIALGSVAPSVIRCPDAEAAVTGRPLGTDSIEAAGVAAAAAIRPIDDIRGTAEYRAHAVVVLVRRTLAAIAAGREREAWPRRPALLFDAAAPATPTPARRCPPLEAIGTVEATVNGEAVAAPATAGETLLDWVRDGAGLTGTKEGCAEGECGACTVVLDGQAVLACLVPAARAHGASVMTVEGLAGAHPVQDAFVARGAVQCGFCTPGFVVAAAQLVETDGSPALSDEEVRRGLAGNLCRCTGYASIVDAVVSIGGR